jgi:methyltransferase-like protein 23
MLKTEFEYYTFGDISLTLCVPNKQELFFAYKTNSPFQPFPDNTAKSSFPFWAKIWHSAKALSLFIVEHPGLLKDKTVLELAAGLGLPGLVAANYAQQVICTDYIPDAVNCIQQSIVQNGIKNMHSKIVDWNAIPDDLLADSILMSDVNYEPAEFEVLYKVFMHFLEKGSSILLASPQRLMAKPFIERLLPFCKQNTEYEIEMEEEKVFVNVLLLQGEIYTS